MKKLILSIIFICFCFTSQAQIEKYKELYKSYKIVDDKGADDSYNEKKFHRWLSKWHGILDKDGNITDNIGFSTIEQRLNTLKKKEGNTKSTNSLWTSLGPNSSRLGIGRLNVVAFHPTNDNIIFVGAPDGGFWKTIDGGQHWTTSTDHLGSIGISTIVLSPDDPDVIYAGTGDKDLWDSVSIGVIKSTDGGNSWSNTGLSFSLSDQKQVTGLLIDTNNANILYASTKSAWNVAEVYKSTDHGSSWSLMHSFNGSITDLEILPANNQYLFVGMQDGSLYRSIDGGSNWNDITSSMSYTDSDRGMLTLASTPAAPNSIYILAEGTPEGRVTSGIYVSTNAGDSFVKKADNSAPTPVNWYGYTLAVSPTNPDQIYCGGGYAFHSSDGGTTFTLVHQAAGGSDLSNYVHVDMHGMEYRSSGEFFIACDGGLYKTNNPEGPNYLWDYISGNMVIGQVYGFGSSNSNPNKIALGFQDLGAGVLNQQTFDQYIGGDGMECAFDPIDDDIVYVSYQTGYIFKFFNNASSYTHFVNPNKVNGEGGAWTTPFVINQNNGDIAWAGYQNVWKTFDGGDTWQKLGDLTTVNDVTIKKVIPWENDTGIIYIVKEWGNGAYRTENNGDTWTELSNIENTGISSLAVSTDNSNYVWATGAANGKKIYKSTDAGSTWSNISYNLSNTKIGPIIYQKNSPDRVFVGTNEGVYYMEENDTEWTKLGEGYPNVHSKKLEINYDTMTLRVGTYGRGVWEHPINDTVLSTSSHGFVNSNLVANIFPNPTKDMINISLSEKIDGSLIVSNIMGQRLIHNTISSKENSISLKGLVKGIYIISIETEKGIVLNSKIIRID